MKTQLMKFLKEKLFIREACISLFGKMLFEQSRLLAEGLIPRSLGRNLGPGFIPVIAFIPVLLLFFSACTQQQSFTKRKYYNFDNDQPKITVKKSDVKKENVSGSFSVSSQGLEKSIPDSSDNALCLSKPGENQGEFIPSYQIRKNKSTIIRDKSTEKRGARVQDLLHSTQNLLINNENNKQDSVMINPNNKASLPDHPFALASVLLSILSISFLTISGWSFLAALFVAMVIGFIAIRKTNKQPDKYKGKDLAKTGIVISMAMLLILILGSVFSGLLRLFLM